jgi:2-oxoglutarate dehydrogenase E2 component (dihydrolipoamide succinyltransferase)
VSDIQIPKLNTNDMTYVLVEWLATEGAQVEQGTPVVVVETAKATEELPAPHSGVLRRLAEEGAHCPVGAVIGRLYPDQAARQADVARTDTTPNRRGEEPSGTCVSAASDSDAAPDIDLTGLEPVLTGPARTAVVELGITAVQLRSLGQRILKRRDIEQLAASSGTSPRVTPTSSERTEVLTTGLSATQRRIARTVARAHREIPDAYVVIKVYVDVALAALELATAAAGTPIGLPELLVKIAGTLRGRFPLVFASPADEHSLTISDGARIGVTLDVGNGLFIPVVREPASLSVRQIADILMGYRVKALRKAFTEADLTEGNLTISLHNDTDVVLARPIIVPDQTAMFCLCATQEELHLNAAGQVDIRRYVNLGLAYDHRVMNGRDAVLVLQFMKALCEDADKCAGLMD